MRSYLEILTELKDTVETDRLPEALKVAVVNTINGLFELLYPYSH